jgi:hypothetical protein
LGQLQPFIAVFPTGIRGPTCIFGTNLTPLSLKDKDEKVLQGFYHTQWDIQMGEESFGEAKQMNGEQPAPRDFDPRNCS